MTIPKGTRVRTISVPHPPTDWNEWVRKTRRFGIMGTVITRSYGHGECYEVQHEKDGILSAYEPQELEIVPPAPPFWRVLINKCLVIWHRHFRSES